jgi:aspartyl-tRNA(Asn)/glutamyl-tRNA(Gln) amidotransferase subunit B
MNWEIVIGLEIHVQLATKSKIFSGASNQFGEEPNSQTSVVDLGFPGALPVLNQKAVEMAIAFGLACHCEIPNVSLFARKNYFYPDLPSGYQTSQFDQPIVGEGYIDIELPDGEQKRVRITRAHLEEDAGKSLHEDFSGMTGIDLNRAGTPLLEIVSEPDMRSAAEAAAYMRAIHTLVRYLGISDGNMQEGSFRCDANVSVRPLGETELGTRTEIKNLNSFRFIERAINYEVERQIDEIEAGRPIIQQTRLYDTNQNVTRAMRDKEDSDDYRYFTDPNLLPVVIEESLVESIRQSLPELPNARFQRFVDDFELSRDDAHQLTSQRELADYFEETVAQHDASPRQVCNWITKDITAGLNRDGRDINECPISPEQLSLLIHYVEEGKLTQKLAREVVLRTIWEEGGTVDEVIAAKNLEVLDSDEVLRIIDEVISKNASQREAYLAGQEKLFGFFVGQVMRAAQGKADPAVVNKLLKEKL